VWGSCSSVQGQSSSCTQTYMMCKFYFKLQLLLIIVLDWVLVHSFSLHLIQCGYCQVYGHWTILSTILDMMISLWIWLFMTSLLRYNSLTATSVQWDWFESGNWVLVFMCPGDQFSYFLCNIFPAFNQLLVSWYSPLDDAIVDASVSCRWWLYMHSLL
jgi:hypothetical protein